MTPPRTSAAAVAPSALPRSEWILAILFVAVAVTSQVWQPFVLGFYHDDWGTFVQPRLHPQDAYFLELWARDRPGYSIFRKVLLELWDGRTTTYHLVKIFIDLAAAAALAWTILVYQRAFGARSPALAASSAAFWLVAPWSLGYTLWASDAFTNIAVLLLCLSVIGLARWIERRQVAALVAATAAFGASMLFYQSTWLAAFPFALVLGWREWRERRPLGATVIAFVALGAMQLGSAALSWSGSPKTPNPHILAFLRDNMKMTLWLGFRQFGAAGNKALVAVVLVGASVATAILLWRSASARTRAIAGVLLLLTGLAATCAVYAAAGYPISTVGVMSRTTQMLDFWIAVGGAILFAPALDEARSGRFRWIGRAVSLVLVGACAIAYWPAARPWLRSWELQQAVLAKSAPLAEALRDGDVVVADVPTQIDQVVVFGAPWDITPAVLVHNADRRPNLAHRFLYLQIVPPYESDMSWNPPTFTIMPGWTIVGKRLLVWRWRSGTITTVDHPVASRAELLALFDAR